MKLTEDIKRYVRLHIRQFAFEAVEYIGQERSKILFRVLTLFILLMTTIFASLFGAFWLNEVFDSSYLGFGMVGLIWLISFGLVLLFRRTIKKYFFRSYIEHHIPA